MGDSAGSNLHREVATLFADGRPDLDAAVAITETLAAGAWPKLSPLLFQRAAAVARRTLEIMPSDDERRAGILHVYCELGIAVGAYNGLRLDPFETAAFVESELTNIDESDALYGTLLLNVTIWAGRTMSDATSADDLTVAIDRARRGFRLGSDVDWTVGMARLVLQDLLLLRRDDGDLDEAIDLARSAVYGTSGDGVTPDELDQFSKLLFLRGLESRDERTVREAVEITVRLANAVHDDLRSRVERLNKLARALWLLFQVTRDMDDLHRHIRVRRTILRELDPGHPDEADYEGALLHAVNTWTDIQQQPLDGDEAVRLNCRAVQRTSRDDPRWPFHVLNLFQLLAVRRVDQPKADPVDLYETVRRYVVQIISSSLPDGEEGDEIRAAIEDLPPPELRLAAFGALQNTTAGPDISSLNVEMLESLVDSIDTSAAQANPWVQLFASSLVSMAEESGDLIALRRAVDLYRARIGTEMTSAKPADVVRLMEALRVQADVTRDATAADEAIDLGTQLVARNDLSVDEECETHGVLGVVWRVKHQATGSQADIEAALQESTACLSLTPDDHILLPARLGSHAGNLRMLAETSNDDQLLGEAIEVMRDAVERTPPNHHRRQSRILGLTSMLRVRFRWAGTRADLDAADELLAAAIEASSSASLTYGDLVYSRACCLLERFDAFGEARDGASGIGLARESVDLAPPGHPARPDRLSVLGTLLMKQAVRARDVDLASEGLAFLHEAADAGGRRPTLLDLLAYGFSVHADLTGNRESRRSAVAALREAAMSTSETGPQGYVLKFNLAGALLFIDRVEDRDGRTRPGPELVEAISLYQSVASSLLVPARVRAQAAERWASLAASTQNWPAAAEGYAAAVRALRTLVYCRLPRLDQERTLARWQGLGSAAAAAVLEAEPSSPAQALDLLESGRNFMASQLLDLRADMTRLRAVDPDLTHRLETLSRALDD